MLWHCYFSDMSFLSDMSAGSPLVALFPARSKRADMQGQRKRDHVWLGNISFPLTQRKKAMSHHFYTRNKQLIWSMDCISLLSFDFELSFYLFSLVQCWKTEGTASLPSSGEILIQHYIHYLRNQGNLCHSLDSGEAVLFDFLIYVLMHYDC